LQKPAKVSFFSRSVINIETSHSLENKFRIMQGLSDQAAQAVSTAEKALKALTPKKLKQDKNQYEMAEKTKIAANKLVKKYESKCQELWKQYCVLNPDI
jgi:hypothetical protein